MYQSYSFYAKPDSCKPMQVHMVNAFKITTGSSYYNYLDEKWKNAYPYETISYVKCNCGEMEITTQDKKYVLHEDDYIFINYFDIKNGTILSKQLKFSWVNFIAQNYENIFELNKIYHKELTEEQNHAIDKIFRYGKNQDVDFGYLNTYFSLYLYSIMSEETLEILPEAEPQNTKLIDEMCSYVEQKLYADINVNKIADFFNFSTRRVQQIFADEMNISPKKYIIQKKMEEAYKLVKDTSLPFYEIAEMLCFSSAYHFSRDFKNYFHVTPSVVRAQKIVV